MIMEKEKRNRAKGSGGDKRAPSSAPSPRSHSPSATVDNPTLLPLPPSPSPPSPRLSTGVAGLDELLRRRTAAGNLDRGGRLDRHRQDAARIAVRPGRTASGRPAGDRLRHVVAGRLAEPRRICAADVRPRTGDRRAQDYVELDGFFRPERAMGDYLHVFDHSGRRVTRDDVSFDAWQEWQSEIYPPAQHFHRLSLWQFRALVRPR